MINLEHVSKKYHRGSIEITALNDISLGIDAGEFVSVMGPSGSGKSTLLHLSGCLDQPDSGDVIISGKSTAAMSDNELTLMRRRSIGFIFQFFNLIPTITAAENVAMPLLLECKRINQIITQVDELLEMVGLSDRSDHLPEQLSGGEMQRVAIARALINDPHIILADEPTGNLDSHTGKQIMELIKNIAAGRNKTVIMVTHDQNVADYGDRIILLKDGAIIGSTKEV